MFVYAEIETSINPVFVARDLPFFWNPEGINVWNAELR
jgi:hypothetical protein